MCSLVCVSPPPLLSRAPRPSPPRDRALRRRGRGDEVGRSVWPPCREGTLHCPVHHLLSRSPHRHPPPASTSHSPPPRQASFHVSSLPLDAPPPSPLLRRLHCPVTDHARLSRCSPTVSIFLVFTCFLLLRSLVLRDLQPYVDFFSCHAKTCISASVCVRVYVSARMRCVSHCPFRSTQRAVLRVDTPRRRWCCCCSGLTSSSSTLRHPCEPRLPRAPFRFPSYSRADEQRCVFPHERKRRRCACVAQCTVAASSTFSYAALMREGGRRRRMASRNYGTGEVNALLE